MAEQSDQDVEMEAAHPDTEEIDDPEEKPANCTDNTNQQEERQNTPKPPTTAGPSKPPKISSKTKNREDTPPGLK